MTCDGLRQKNDVAGTVDFCFRTTRSAQPKRCISLLMPIVCVRRRHLSLLRSLASDGRTLIPVHTILELYRVSDMSLVSVMPSAEDEVNAAAFSPLPVRAG